MINDTSQVASRRRIEAVWAATGALTVVLFGCGLLFGDLRGTTNYPALNASSFQLRQYFMRNVPEVRAPSLFHLLAAVALAAFASYLYPTLRASGVRLAALALAGGSIGATFLALSALCYRVLADRSVAGDPALAHALLVLSYLAGGPAIGVPLALTAGAFAAAIRRERTFPVSLWLLGTVAAVLGVATATTLLGPTNNSSAAYGCCSLAQWHCSSGWWPAASCSSGVPSAPRTAPLTPARAPEEQRSVRMRFEEQRSRRGVPDSHIRAAASVSSDLQTPCSRGRRDAPSLKWVVSDRDGCTHESAARCRRRDHLASQGSVNKTVWSLMSDLISRPQGYAFPIAATAARGDARRPSIGQRLRGGVVASMLQ